ncbi:MAG: 2-keto-4-pentenoate hydratase [Amphiplicatus sp.]
MQEKQKETTSSKALRIAGAFVRARLEAAPLPTYPGDQPETLAEAYAIQDAAIRLWPDEIAGWKVGRVPEPFASKLGCDRLAGPIFKQRLRNATAQPASAQAFEGGFAAIEGEFVLILAADAPAEKTSWTIDEARALIESVRAGVEVASSPFAGVNDLGPLVTISDFGNNNGLLLGPEIPDWRAFNLADWRCEVFIDGESVGENDAAAIPGGPLESLRFMLENAARRGLPLKKGAAVSTGAVTGVHQIAIGQTAVLRFTGLDDLALRIEAVAPDERQTAASLKNVTR